MRRRRHAALLATLWLAGCATGSAARDHYLRYTAFEVPGGEHVTLRWRAEQWPLKIHLPAPPPGLATDPEAVLDAVRDGVTDWEGAAGDGIPSFMFVDDPGGADIPIVWEAEPSGGWYVGHCVYHLHIMQRRFGVARILVTTHWRGQPVSLQRLYDAVLHEMGHALGLRGHSPESGDIMYKNVAGAEGLSPRDRETLRLLYSRPNGKTLVGPRSAD